MLLVDASNAASGGAMVLLEYLYEQLSSLGSCHFLVPDNFPTKAKQVTQVPPMSVIGTRRSKLLTETISRLNPKSLFCFGNMPPAQKYKNLRIITYMHNPHLIRSIDHVRYGIKDRVRYGLLEFYFRKRLRVNDTVACQTGYIRDELCDYYGLEKENTAVIPFYNKKALEVTCQSQTTENKESSFIYVSDGRPHKNHLTLLDSWEIISSRLKNPPILKLTIFNSSNRLDKKIQRLQDAGLPIQNLGRLPHPLLMEEVANTKTLIFPSLLETLGLGLVEAVLLGCDVLAADRPYLKEVLRPTAVFDPESPQAIADCVLDYLKACPNTKPEIILQNRINDLVHLLAVN